MLFNEPLNARPMGVRAVETMTASVMGILSLVSLNVGAACTPVLQLRAAVAFYQFARY